MLPLVPLGVAAGLAALVYLSRPSWVKPIQGRKTSSFGWREHPVFGGMKHHNGIDIAAPEGTPIVAAHAGTVVFAGYGSGYGWHVKINHGDGLEAKYGHMSRLATTVGRKVRAGTLIGYCGSTGVSTGPHLHFELRKNGLPTDPEKYIKF